MRKLFLLLIICMMCLTGCADEKSGLSENGNADASSKKYSIGDEVVLADERFNVYKVNRGKNQLYLMAQSNVATTTFSAADRDRKSMHDYDGSLVEQLVDRFVDNLEDAGLVIESSGIIDVDDLEALGFDIAGMNGTKYEIGNAPEFIKDKENFWVGGYCKYDTYSWAYCDGILTTQKCNNEFGVRPVIVIDAGEVDKKLQKANDSLDIKDIVEVECAWVSEGGIANPYDKYFFDCKNMMFTNVFESPALSYLGEFKMVFVDNRTIKVDGVRRGYEIPAEITIVNENKLRVRFIDASHNDGDYYLHRETESQERK